MDISKITFSIHSYDSDGDIYERGIYLHFDETKIRIGNLYCLTLFRDKLNKIIKEVEKNYDTKDL
jgi:hypothetical protein